MQSLLNAAIEHELYLLMQERAEGDATDLFTTDLFAADLFTPAVSLQAPACFTPGNPYILHCFPVHKTDLTAMQQGLLNSIAAKIARSFLGSKPVTRVQIVGHAATWKGISQNEYRRRALVRAENTKAELHRRLAKVGLGAKVDIIAEHRANTQPLIDNRINSSSPEARHNRALNRRVEIKLLPAAQPILERKVGMSMSSTKRFSPRNKSGKCQVVKPTATPLSNCALSHRCQEKKDIDIASAVKQNKRLSIELGWGNHLKKITQAVLFTYPYDVEDPGFAMAIVNWQRENCFKELDGILHRAQWNEMKHTLYIHKKLMRIDLKKKKFLRQINTFMPRSALGLFAKKPPGHRYALPETINALITIGINWWLKHPSAPPIQIRDIGPVYGSTKKWLTHNSHRMGIDVDIGLMRNDCAQQGTHIKKTSYSRKLTQDLINTIVNNGVLKVHKIFFDDVGVTAPSDVLSCDGLHKNHMHVRFCMPHKYNLKAMRKESNTSIRATNATC